MNEKESNEIRSVASFASAMLMDPESSHAVNEILANVSVDQMRLIPVRTFAERIRKRNFARSIFLAYSSTHIGAGRAADEDFD